MIAARDNIYHVACFTCAWCNATLTQGDYFGISNNLVYCRTHFEMRAMAPDHYHQHFLSSEQAAHPLPPECHPSELTGLPAYAAMYGSPINATSGLLVTQPARKGRPRKRKTIVPTDGTLSPGVASCLMDGVAGGGGGGPASASSAGGQQSAVGQNISGEPFISLLSLFLSVYTEEARA